MSSTDTSVSVSLAEIARLEDERIERERSERRRAERERAERVRRAQAKEAAEQAARRAADAEIQAERQRQQAIEKARLEARQRAEVDVARIQAEARVRLEADNAARAHELEVLRIRRQTGRRRREYVLGALLAIAIVVGVGRGSAQQSARDASSRTVAELRDRERALTSELDGFARTELAALDRRHAGLLALRTASLAGEPVRVARAARAAIERDAPTREGLRAFADALDALDARLAATERLAALESRERDLSAWAKAMRRRAITHGAERAAQRAKAPGAGPDAIAAWERELDRLRDVLAKRASGGEHTANADPIRPVAGRCHSGDPGCGLDGKPLF